MRETWSALILGLLAISSPVLAADTPDERAQAIVRDARKLREYGKGDLGRQALEAALDSFQAAADAAPEDANQALGLARLQFELERDEAAARNLEKAIKLQPKSPEPRAFKGWMLLQTGQAKEAEAEYLAALELAPQNPQWKTEYARYLFRIKRQADGRAQVQAALELNAGHPDAALLQGMLLEREGKSTEALRLLENAVKLNGKSVELRELLGGVYHSQDKHAEAYEQFAAITKVDPRNIDAEIRLLQLAAALKKPADVERHHARVYELQKDELVAPDWFRRERLEVGKHPVVAQEYFELKGATPVKYRFTVFDEGGKELYRITLGSYEVTTAMSRSTRAIKETERMYHLDYYDGPAHRTYGFFPATPPTYAKTREMVSEIIEGKRAALSGSNRETKAIELPLDAPPFKK